MSLPKLHIKKQHDIRVNAGSPWVYSNEIANFSELKSLAKGSLVEIHTPMRGALAVGYFNASHLISARILSYDLSEKINEEFFAKKIMAAKNLRKKFFDKPFYRLIHSEADGLPGLVVDCFGDVLSCQISTVGMQNLSEFLVAALKEIFPDCAIIFRNDIDARRQEGLELETKIIHGKINKTIIEENGLKFALDVTEGQKTGWFFDQRENRNFIASIAKNSHMLDAFCYQGGFGLNALKGGAKSVTFIDSSESAIAAAKHNLALNFSATEQKNCEFVEEKVFEALEKFAAEKKQFNLVVLDPPAFVKSKKDLAAGLRGYEKLVRLAAPLLKENAVLMLASCSHNVMLSDLIEAASHGLRKALPANRSAKLIRSFGASFDHPVHPMLKESEYLKSVTFVV